MATNIPRLDYGFVSQSLDPINMKLPWQLSVRDGLFKMNYKIEDATIDELRFWAKTKKGEYIMDLKFGLDIPRYLFSPIPILKDNVQQNIREQMPLYFPDIKPYKVQILTTEDKPEINENTVLFRFEGTIVSDKTRQIKFEELVGG